MKDLAVLLHYRELLVALVVREIRVRYKQTIFGMAWAILQPAALTLIFTIVFGTFLKVPSGNIPYPIFAFSALLPWTFFTTAVSFGAVSVVNNGNLVTKVFFPREILPLSSIGAALFDFAIALIVYLLLAIYFDVSFSWYLLFLFWVIPALLIFTAAVTIFLAALNVIFRDIRFIVPLALQVWLYLSPVIYPVEQTTGKFKLLILLNPMTPIITSFRDAIAFGKKPDLVLLTISTLVSFIMLAVAYVFFKNKDKIFADII